MDDPLEDDLLELFPPEWLRKKIPPRAIIATPMTTAASMPTRTLRLFRTALLRGGDAFFGVVLFFLPCSVLNVLVLNWLLLLFYYFFLRFCCFCCFLAVVCTCP